MEKIQYDCKVCNKGFKPTNKKQLELDIYIHETMSERHKSYLRFKGLY